jgi:hypothetical protein
VIETLILPSFASIYLLEFCLKPISGLALYVVSPAGRNFLAQVLTSTDWQNMFFAARALDYAFAITHMLFC